jgi:hypothetical protein
MTLLIKQLLQQTPVQKKVKKYSVEYMELYSLKRYGILICEKYTGANVSEVQATSIFRTEVVTVGENGM